MGILVTVVEIQAGSCPQVAESYTLADMSKALGRVSALV